MISVLYLDDEQTLLEIAKIFLEKTGRFYIDTADTYEIAKKKLETATYDAIISDYQMPIMDGIGFLKFVRKNYGRIPFLLFTGKGREEIVIQALENGADFYIQKGGDPQAQFAELANKIEKAVSEQKAVTARKDSEQRLADIISFLPDATLAIDREGTVIAWNHAIELMTGVPARDMLGKGNYEYAMPFYHERRPLLLNLLLETDETSARHYDTIGRNGNKLISEKYISDLLGGKGAYLWFIASPFYDSRGNLAGAIESIRDITQQKKLEDSLRASERRYRNVFESAAEATIIVDRSDGRILDANMEATKLYGYSLEEFRSLRSGSLTTDGQRMIRQDHSGRMYIARKDQLRKDGKIFPAEITGNIYPQKKRSIAIINIRDITEAKKAQELLYESENRFRELTELLPQIVYEIDTRGILRYTNRIAFDIFGYSREDFLKGLRVIDMIAPADRERAAEDLRSLFAGETDNNAGGEYLARKKDGTVFPVLIYSAPIRKDGAVSGLRGIIIDITERKQAEEALAKSERRFRTILDQALDPIFLHNRDGRIVNVNRNACTSLGYSREELLMKTIGDFDREAILGGKGNLWDRVIGGQTFTFESTHIRKDGTTFPVEISIGPIQLEGGILVMGVVRDLTERKKTTETLLANEERFRTIFQNSSDLVRVLDRHGRIVYDAPSSERILGYPYGSLIGKDPVEYIHPDDRDRVRAELRKVYDRTNPRIPTEFRIRKSDGTYLWVESVGVNLLGVPAVDSIVVTTHPIAERKAGEEALKTANRQLNLLTSSTRHNVLNKITAVLGYLRLVTLKNPDAGTTELITKAYAEVNAIRAQIAFTAIYNDQGKHEPVWQDPAELIAALPAPEAVILKNTLRNIQIQADPMLVSVFENLLDNSLRHGGRVTRIAVSSTEEDGVLKIRWEDNGVGVPAGEKQKIFGQGYGRHTGLGLFLVREILSLTGMTIRENGEPGEGARFEIIIPQDRFRAINRKIVP